MPISFACDCGQTITARDEYAGRRVRCSKCKKTLTVPGELSPAMQTMAMSRPPDPPEFGTPSPPAETERDGPSLVEPIVEEDAPPGRTGSSAIRFHCACGANYQASPAHGGQPARCPLCGDILYIPARTTAGRIVAASHDREDQYRPEEEPRRSPWRVLVVALVLLLVLAGGGFAAWQFYFKDIAEQVEMTKAQAVSWTAPRDMAYSPQTPPGGLLGKHYSGGSLIATADGAV